MIDYLYKNWRWWSQLLATILVHVQDRQSSVCIPLERHHQDQVWAGDCRISMSLEDAQALSASQALLLWTADEGDAVRYKVVIIHRTPEQRPDFAGDMRVIALRKVSMQRLHCMSRTELLKNRKKQPRWADSQTSSWLAVPLPHFTCSCHLKWRPWLRPVDGYFAKSRTIYGMWMVEWACLLTPRYLRPATNANFSRYSILENSTLFYSPMVSRNSTLLYPGIIDAIHPLCSSFNSSNASKTSALAASSARSQDWAECCADVKWLCARSLNSALSCSDNLILETDHDHTYN